MFNKTVPELIGYKAISKQRRNSKRNFSSKSQTQSNRIENVCCFLSPRAHAQSPLRKRGCGSLKWCILNMFLFSETKQETNSKSDFSHIEWSIISYNVIGLRGRHHLSIIYNLTLALVMAVSYMA